MRSLVVAFSAGLLFGIGLVVSGLSRPDKLLACLDLGAIPTGNWDASLIFVMAGALLVAIPGYALARRRAKPICDLQFHLPIKTSIDRRLILGSAMFGFGWGLVGYCPTVALTALLLVPQSWPFILAMITGMTIFALFQERRARLAI